MGYIIGVDFDNTIINYDDVIYDVALRQGLIHPELKKTKKDIRDGIRQLPEGEIEWQKLQAIVYGPGMGEARPVEGVRIFFESCKKCNVKVYIISHKTEFASSNRQTNLREAAMTWIENNHFFQANGFGLSRKDVYFEATRYEKIQRIKQLGCTHYIDDLEETFLEESFPGNVEKILYGPHICYPLLPGVRVANTWGEIIEYLFDAKS